MTQTWTLVIYCGLILLVSAAGGLLPLRKAVTHKRLQIYLSFSAGVMLGAALFHMLPEVTCLSSGPQPFWFVALGLLVLFFTERFAASHHHEPHGHEHAEGGSKLSWPAALFGLTIHTLAAGVALASAVAAETTGHGKGALGLGVFLAIVLHKPADSLTVITLMVNSGVSRVLAHLVNILFALVIPIGVILFFAARAALETGLDSSFTGLALAFSAGMFLCVSLSDLLPELHFHEHDRVPLSIALLAGIGLMFVTGLTHNHGHGHAGHQHGIEQVDSAHEHDHGAAIDSDHGKAEPSKEEHADHDHDEADHRGEKAADHDHSGEEHHHETDAKAPGAKSQ